MHRCERYLDLSDSAPYGLVLPDPITGIWRDYVGLTVGRDFVNLWMMGRAAWEPNPAQYYDMHTYIAELFKQFGTDYPWQQWSYPPSVLLLAAPFGLLPYGVALSAWTTLNIGAFLLAARQWCVPYRFLLLASPAAYLWLICGQASLLILAAFLVIFRYWHTHPVRVGLLISLLTLKPQVGLLLPVAMLAARHWRMIAAATLGTAAIALTTAALFGWEVWSAYILQGIPEQHAIVVSPSIIIRGLQPTVLMGITSTGISYNTAILVQIGAALLAAIVLWRAFRPRANTSTEALFAHYACAALMASFYAMSYDLVMIAWAAIPLILRVSQPSRLVDCGAVVMYFLPIACFLLHISHLPAIIWLGSLGMGGCAPVLFNKYRRKQ